MARTIRIDFVADVACPWCVVGIHSLLSTLAALRDEVNPELYLQPFELNPELGPQGENVVDHAVKKYGTTREEAEAGIKRANDQAALYGFALNQSSRSRVWNTRDAHRLLFWTGLDGNQMPLFHALYRANFTEQRSVSDHAVLLDLVGRVGLDVERARALLSSDEFASDVESKEQSALQNGIIRVPTVVFDQRWTVQGAQTPQIYAQAMRDIISSEPLTQ
ncbi:MAG: disulfide bond formation protein DsbA [Alphaproteobacteria bacterium]|nr:MAG: disulfide bond formation protein DsbA [Alphaproteobacteria bacterium]